MYLNNNMFRLIYLLVFIYPAWSLAGKSLGPLIQTKSGAVRGHYLTSYKGNIYEAYQGIPYAQPPTGEKRFRSPVPVDPWSNELNATKLKEQCMQDKTGQPNKPVIGSEDCLHLNVYVPTKRKTNDFLPVIFYIYGGAFRRSGARDGQEQYIIDYDVIFVSANYRTGSLGFLSTEDDVVPGNMALKDQSTALRWTYDNIEAFGGDPKRITLLGGSAGGVCLHHHYLSPWSRGLFHAGMSLSGTAFAYMAKEGHSRRKAIALGRAVNCTDDDVAEMVECMRNVPAEDLVAAQSKLEVWQGLPSLFGLVVEKFNSVDPFISDYPHQILREGKAYDVPWINAITAEEGLIMTAAYTLNNTLEYIDENWESLAPLMLNYMYAIPEEQYASIARKIRNHYLGEKPINRENFRAFTHLVGDRIFGVTAVNAARAQASANKSPVYFYYYNYRATDSLSNQHSNSTEDFGVCHGDDILLVIGNPTIFPTKSPEDMAMQRRLIQIFTSMAYNGVPDVGVDWRSVSSLNSADLNYLIIAGPNDLKLASSNNLAENKFWNSIDFDEK